MDIASIANGVGGSSENGLHQDVIDGSTSSGHKRSLSGSLLSKLSFLRGGAESIQTQAHGYPSNVKSDEDEPTSPKKGNRALAVAVQQQKTRRRRGSLRKAALLGRGAQRDRKEQILPATTDEHTASTADGATSPTDQLRTDRIGLGISEAIARLPTSQYAANGRHSTLPPLSTVTSGSGEGLLGNGASSTSPTLTYTSTTDEEDVLLIPKHQPSVRTGLALSSGSDSYLPSRTGSLGRRRSTNKPTSPLSIGLAANSLPIPDADWDYSGTEWWGWVILIMTWIVFVVGMGSCLGIWSWAWDVGETPYAPPELEDDPTLPIVGYYPALIILTGVMAWVWVGVAWVGMKYFRHAKISGD